MSLERTIYIDESFFEWPGLAEKGVNIAYGAVSIPDRSLALAKKRWKSFEKMVRCLVFDETGISIPLEKEIKGTHANSLKPESLHEVGRFLAAFFKKHHIRSFGLFAMAEGFGNNSIRNDAYDKTPEEFEDVLENQEALYTNWLEQVSTHRQTMKAAGKGDIGSFEKLINPFVSCILHNHLDAKVRQPFRLVWDHRCGEDEGLKEIVAAMVEDVRKSMQLSDVLLGRYYRGLKIRRSHEEAGLRFADIVAGSYRNVFRAYPELLTDNTEFKIKSAKFNDEMLSPWMPFYKRPMSPELSEAILTNTRDIVFPHLIPTLAGGLFTYFTKNGDARHCRPSDQIYFDMAD